MSNGHDVQDYSDHSIHKVSEGSEHAGQSAGSPLSIQDTESGTDLKQLLGQVQVNVSSRGSGPVKTAALLRLQQTVGNHAVQRILAAQRNSNVSIQRTIDQDARRWSMDWLATWARPFPQAVKKFMMPKLYAICVGVMGEEQPLAPVQPTQVDRATYTTALAAGLVQMGAEKAGQLSSRLADKKEGLLELIQELEGAIPETIPALKLATAQTQADFQNLDLPDPFLVLTSGGAQFTFSKEMALHMMRRHHPKYLSGPPLQVQSFFDPNTTIPNIRAIIQGTVNKSAEEIKEWRKFRAKKTTDLTSEAARNLNLRPVWDGKYWELTLSIESTNRQESKGKVAHFTPTL